VKNGITARVTATIEEHHLLSRNQHALAGVSGGADSMALLHSLHELAPTLDLRLTVAHLDHGVRDEAKEDAAFVRQAAADLGLPFVEDEVDVPALAGQAGISLEMAARQARYEFFARAAKGAECDAVATAHTANDQAETALLKLARGAGRGGLAGISYRTRLCGVRVIRPFLDLNRQDIETYLSKRGIEWREDSSNKDMTFLRNRVRHEILPMLSDRLNPGITETLSRSANIWREEDKWMNSLAMASLARCEDGGALLVAPLLALCVAERRRILRLWLSRCGEPVGETTFDTIARIERAINSVKGTHIVPLPGGRSLRREYDRLLVEPDSAWERGDMIAVPLAIPGRTVIWELGIEVNATIARGIVKDSPGVPGRLPARASLRHDPGGNRRICVRNRRSGDIMGPLGMSGTRKLQDIFTDTKVPVRERDKAPIFECRDEIIWIPGYRVARGWDVPDETARALHLQVDRLGQPL